MNLAFRVQITQFLFFVIKVGFIKEKPKKIDIFFQKNIFSNTYS